VRTGLHGGSQKRPQGRPGRLVAAGPHTPGPRKPWRARRSPRAPARAARAAPGAALAAAALLAGCAGGGRPSAETSSAAGGRTGAAFQGAALPQPKQAPAFVLRDAAGNRVALPARGGRVTIVSFLDSTCRVCVLVGQQIRGALDELQVDQTRDLAPPTASGRPAPAVLIVSVDPALDTPARTAAFLAQVSLTGRARYLTGPASTLAAASRAYGVTTLARGQQRFEAAATVFLIDARGRERVLYQQEQLTPEALAHDVRVLRSG
jgi:cytochrome oxidase Cu insertion factor (SCO1/SenC/PrrC family)